MPNSKQKTFYEWQKAAAGILFPQRLCVSCGAVSPDGPLCPDCRDKQQRLRPCPYCAAFIAATETADYCCSECRQARPPFQLARAAMPYQGYLRERLLDFKYRDRPGLRRPLAALLKEAFARYYGSRAFDALTPVPLSPCRERERGYNQAELLSALLSRELLIPHHPEYLRRVRETRPLAALTRREREAELKGAFRADPRTAGQRILLIDDIYTSGATAAAATRALQKAGAGEVWVLAVAAGEDL